MKATVADRGQVTIPKALRKRLGIKPGTILDFEIKGSTLMAVKTTPQDPVSQVYGCLGKLQTDKIMTDLRGKT